MWSVWVVIGAIFCAAQAIRERRLLASSLWLAGVSIFVAIALYALGAREVAVIELSVGTGLVPVLLVFAIGVTGAGAADAGPLVPRPLGWGMAILATLLLGWMLLPTSGAAPAAEPSFSDVLWRQRGLDVLAQIALLIVGALGVLGLLSEGRAAQADLGLGERARRIGEPVASIGTPSPSPTPARPLRCACPPSPKLEEVPR